MDIYLNNILYYHKLAHIHRHARLSPLVPPFLSLHYPHPKRVSSLSRKKGVLFHIKGIAKINMGLEDLKKKKKKHAL